MFECLGGRCCGDVFLVEEFFAVDWFSAFSMFALAATVGWIYCQAGVGASNVSHKEIGRLLRWGTIECIRFGGFKAVKKCCDRCSHCCGCNKRGPRR